MVIITVMRGSCPIFLVNFLTSLIHLPCFALFFFLSLLAFTSPVSRPCILLSWQRLPVTALSCTSVPEDGPRIQHREAKSTFALSSKG
jgi:hypothetical protein